MVRNLNSYITNISESTGKDIPILLQGGPYSKVEISILHIKNSSSHYFWFKEEKSVLG